ncbi:MAG: carboxypeptidase regulatory-like domain-containing protein [Saprospiraceae bacterium]|nr:carboxypeptidase regulatory-like domain-containing protein [Saprospiraceae bacterium]
MNRPTHFSALIGLLLMLVPAFVFAQGVTTSSIVGRITDANGEALIGANILVTHLPSGTVYGNATDLDGYYRIPGMRVGGPYQVTITYTGFEEQTQDNIFLSLGTAATLNFSLTEQAIDLAGVVVTSDRNDVFSGNRTGAASNLNSTQLNALPTFSRNVLGFARLVPQANGTGFGTSFGGQDNRLNNITIDGSLMNNSFGLAGEPGGRTGVSPISLDAIEELQVNLAPYDVRQSGFVGAGINAVTRSGTNEFSGSAFYFLRNEGLVGDEARGRSVTTSNFDYYNTGFRLGGPIIKNKLFFFASGEIENRSEPFNLRANRGEAAGGDITSVRAEDLDAVSEFLRTNYGYETGPYEGYDLATKANKFLLKLDYNLNKNNKISLRYSYLDSDQDVLISTSSSLGFGARRGPASLSYQNSNYIINDDIQSIVGEWNSIISNKISNNLIINYTTNNEDRGTYGSFFPLIEIQQNGRNYISTGFEPFTPNNRLSYQTFQIADNLSIYLKKHTVTAGFNFERLSFENVFFPGSQGVFVYNSLDDFYADLAASKDSPTRTTSDITLRRFQYRYSALPGGAEPVQPSAVTYPGIYIQDEYAASDRLNLTFGIRADVPFFDNTGFENARVATETYSLQGEPIKISTSKLPDPKVLLAPRFGFNYDIKGDKSLQVRGGSGLFTGRPVFVWISNQIGNNGVLTGFEQIDNTKNRPFTTDPGRFIANAAAPASYELAVTDPDFKFLQVWRTNLALDAKLPLGIIATLEFIYNKNVNGYVYYNVNERDASATFSGSGDNRNKYPGSGLSGSALNNAIRLNPSTVNAMYLSNTNEGDSYTATVQLKKTFNSGLFVSGAYNYGRARDLMSAGSIAAGSYNGTPSVNGNNYLELTTSANELRHRILGIFGYRIEYANFGATQISFTLDSYSGSPFSYVYNQDMNGDGVNGNDLVHVPTNGNQTRFLSSTVSGVTFTPEQQQAAWEAYISQDEYLSSIRGGYAERNGGTTPWFTDATMSIVQDFFVNVGGKRNTLQLRADFSNFLNMLNSDWGVRQGVIQSRPMSFAGVAADGTPQFRMQTVTGADGKPKLLDSSFQYLGGLGQVWQAQIGVRYIFN